MASQAAQMAMAEQEMEALTDMFYKMMKGCQTKCIPPKYADAELTKAESVCVDRCVIKYMTAHEFIGKKMTEMQAALAEQSNPQTQA